MVGVYWSSTLYNSSIAEIFTSEMDSIILSYVDGFSDYFELLFNTYHAVWLVMCGIGIYNYERSWVL